MEQDTVYLLQECDAGIQMGISSMEEVHAFIHNDSFRECLKKSLQSHQYLKNRVEEMLREYHEDGKEINPLVQGMSQLKTQMKLVLDESDAMIADMIWDGIYMGIQSLIRYLNQYRLASEKAKDLVKELIVLEEKLAYDIRPYL